MRCRGVQHSTVDDEEDFLRFERKAEGVRERTHRHLDLQPGVGGVEGFEQLEVRRRQVCDCDRQREHDIPRCLARCARMGAATPERWRTIGGR